MAQRGLSEDFKVFSVDIFRMLRNCAACEMDVSPIRKGVPI